MHSLSQKMDIYWSRLEALQVDDLYHYFQPIEAIDGGWVVTQGQRKVMLATYSYLGLLHHPRVIAAAQAATAKYGAGSHGTRILGGTLDLHDQLENKIAHFFKREHSIVYNSGYITNLATLSTLVERGDWVISDKWNHASIVDGCRLSEGKFKRFRHNDMADLERLLQEAPKTVNKLVVADAVFSMDGDIFNLPDAVALCQKYDAYLMIDEAHSLGVLGATGRGIEEHFSMRGSVDILMGTMSKTIPGIGGYIAGSKKLINYLRHRARGFIFSAALPASVTAAALEAFSIVEEEGAVLNKKLIEKVNYFIRRLQDAGFDTGNTCTAIVPIMMPNEDQAMRMTQYCQNHGLFVLPVLPPAVPEGGARLRANLTVDHCKEDIDFAVKVLIEAAKTTELF
jgi:8-amino-7-oxononanoate synthase